MAITLADLKWKKSERLTDNPDGGGRMTGTEIVDGIVGNLFPNISRVNRAGGAVNLRKAFPHVATNNTDEARDAGAIVVAPPEDPRVSLVMFGTGSDFDERDAARNYVESYVVRGPVSPYRLYDTHQSGQRVVLAWCEPAQQTPEVGEVFCLSVEADGFDEHELFVRLEEVSFVDQVFLYDGGATRTWRIYTLRINKPLDQQFPGEDPQTIINPRLQDSRTKLRRTQVAAAARYYGVTTLAEAAVPGDVTIQVGSIYNQLVPASTDPQGLVDQLPGGVKTIQIPAGPPVTVNVATGSLSSSPKAVYLGNGIVPGSLTMTAASEGGVTYADAGGALVSDTPTARCIGSPVDYDNGVVTLNADAFGGTYTFEFTPGATVAQSPRSQLQEIDLETQRFVYTFSLRPYPAPGSVVVAYRALGRWYALEDDGSGHLVSVLPNTGTGTVDYQTGNAVVTFASLPDVGSAVVVNWGEPEIYETLAGTITVDAPEIVVYAPLDGVTEERMAIEPGTVSISWTNGGARTATANAAGVISGDATGRVYHGEGIVRFRPNSLPVSGTVYTVAMDYGTRQLGAGTGSLVGTELSGTLSPAPVRAGSVRLSVPRAYTDSLPAGWWQVNPKPELASVPPLVVVDDGAGNLVPEGGGAAIGAITYSTGEFTVETADTVTVTTAHKQGA